MLISLFRRARQPAEAVRLFCAYSFAFAFCYALTATLSLVFMAATLGLTPLQMVLVGTVLEAVTFLFEVPTGVVSDRYSRRLSIVIGVATVGVGFLLQGLATGFVSVLAAQVVWGVGFTFISGSDDAWITDEIGAERIGPVFTRAEQLSLAGTIAGTLAAGGLGLLGIRVPLVVSGVGLVVLAGALALTMTGHGFTRTPAADRETFRGLGRSVRTGLAAARHRPVVRGLLVVSLLTGLSEEAVDRLWTLHLVRQFALPDLPGGGTVLLFTGITLAGTVIALLVSLAVNRVSPDRLGAAHPNGVLAVLSGVQVIAIGVLALAGSSPQARRARPFDPGAFASERSRVAGTTLASAAGQLVSDLAAIGGGRACTVVAHSLGGAVVAAAAEAAPELFDALVLISAMVPVAGLRASADNATPEMADSLLPRGIVADPGVVGAVRCDFDGPGGRDLARRTLTATSTPTSPRRPCRCSARTPRSAWTRCSRPPRSGSGRSPAPMCCAPGIGR